MACNPVNPNEERVACNPVSPIEGGVASMPVKEHMTSYTLVHVKETKLYGFLSP